MEWARRDPRRVAWLSLDSVDDDPGALLHLLASAFERALPEQAGLASAMSGPGVSALGRGAPRLASLLGDASAPFVLLVDDLHELRSTGCHDVLSVVLAGVPAGSQAVTASRAEQPHLPRLRAAGDAVELRAADLALDAPAAEIIFANARVEISPEQAFEVAERTEGWPVGLHLAAMIARDARSESWVVTGDDRFVADYLHRETLSVMDEGMQDFVRRTAVLDRFTAPLCDAVTGGSDGSERLRALEWSNTFLVPLDRTREWYRYHPMFRDFLLAELRRSEPELVESLRVNAADWFEAHGSPVMAVEYLLASKQHDRCADSSRRWCPEPTARGRWRRSSAGWAHSATPPSGPTRRWPSWRAGSRRWWVTRPTRNGGRPSWTRSRSTRCHTVDPPRSHRPGRCCG